MSVIVANLWSARRRIAVVADFSRAMKTSFSVRENQHAKATCGRVRVALADEIEPSGRIRSTQVDPGY
jgi:hypothetical protein